MTEAEPLPIAPLHGSDIADNVVVRWLWRDGWSLPDMPAIARGLGRVMNDAGIALMRLRLTLRVLHPQLAGLSYTWLRDGDRIEEFWPPLSVLQEETFLKSPYRQIYEGAGAIRRRLDLPGADDDFPILQDLRASGATDYVALPVVFSDGSIHASTYASDRPGGFSTAELQIVADTIPVLARLMELHLLRISARTILDTYLGRITGARVLSGAIHRGDGEDIFAVIWFSDLRGSTALADRLPRRSYLDLLNAYFDAMAGAVLAEEGEVLKFIGDALLAIFPVEPRTAAGDGELGPDAPCARALRAARDAIARMDAVNAGRSDQGEPALRYGIALHLGNVMFGNIGAPQRLDFTVIGPAVNEASRLSSLCKTLDCPLLISAPLARHVGEPLISRGVQALRGVGEPIEVFTTRECPVSDRLSAPA